MDEVKTTEELYNELVLKEEKRRSNKSEGNLGLGTAMVLQNKAGKMDFSEYSPYQNSDFYKTLTDGSRVAKFENYMPGTDNNERFARTQSSSDQVFNGLTKAVVNFGTTVVGNTVGLVGGLANGVAEGSFNAVFDNKFTNYLADLNEKLDYQLPNYVSKDEQDDNFFESMANANFWAKDVAGAFSFTLGTAVSEAIWAVTTGGAANASKWALKAAQAGKFAKNLVNVEKTMVGLNQAKKMIAGATSKMFTGSIDNVMDVANTASKWGKIANTSRFLVTTSANEAGIEALHYKREARENFNENFERQNGRPPTSDDINEFEENLGHSANAVFATNMAILAPSNLVMFGSAFNIASPFRGMAKGFNKSVFGVGTELVEEGGEKIFKGIVASGKQKVARIAFAVTKPIATEGLFEEGLQGVTTKTAKSWIESTYDPKYTNQTMSLADATYNAFGEQYGTKEGWKEIGIGGIVGGISSVASGRGKFQEIRDFNREQEYQDKYVASGYNRFGDNSTASSITMAKKFMTDARVKEATERKIKAGKDGDDIGFALANQDILVSEIQFRASIGEDTKDLIGKYETALNAMSKEDYAEQGITDIDSYKKTVLEGYTSLINSHEKASKFADSIYGDTSIMGIDSKTMETRQLKEALTRSIVSGQTANKAMDSILGEMGVIIGNDTVKATDIQRDLSRMGRNTQSRVNTLNKSILQAETEQKLLTSELQKLQVSKDETKGARLQTVQAKLNENFIKLTDLKNKREELAKEVSQESKRRRGVDISISKDEKGKNISLLSEYITGEDLENLDKNLQKIEDSIKGYEGVNHEVYYDLLELKKQYGLAEQRFLGYQDAISGLVNKEFKPNFAKVSPFWSKVFLQKQTINDFSKAYIENAYNTYRDSIGQTVVNDLTEDLNISDNDYRAFKELGEVSDEIKAQIAERVKNKEDLTQREKEIYDIFITDINNLTKTIINPNKPDLSPQASNQKEIQNLEAEKAELEKQLIINEDTELEKINNKLDEFKKYFAKNGKSDKESDNLALASISEKERQYLRDNYNKEKTNFLELNPTIITVEDGDLYEFTTPIGVIAGVMTSSTEFRIDGISANEVGKGQGSKMFESLINYLKNKQVETITTDSAGEGAKKMHQKAVDKGTISKVSEEGRNAVFSINNTQLEQTAIQQKISDINKQIEKLKVENRDGVLTQAEALRQEAETAFKKDYPLITIDVDEIIKGRPSENEIEKYKELYSKRDSLNLFESEEFQELQPRMQSWFMAESLPSIRDMSLAQVIELIEQLETQTEKEQTVTEVTAEDILNSAEIKDAQAVNNEKILQNRAGSAVAKIQKNKEGVTEIFMSQVSARDLVGKLLSTGTTFREIRTINKAGKIEEVKDLTDALLEKNYDVAGTQFTIGEIKFEIGQRGNIVMNIDSYDKSKDIINKYYVDSKTGSWSWGDLYEMRGDGLKYKLSSEFNTNTISDAIYDVAVGEDLDIFVDLDTDYNKRLIYKAMQDVVKDNVVSDKTKENIFKNLELTTKKYRVNNSTLKASGENTTDDNFMLIRKRFAEKFINIIETEGLATFPKKIEMQVEVPVSDIFLGTPNFVLDENNQPIEFNFDQRSLERPDFITQGYAIGGEMFFADKKVKTENVSRLYISNLEKQNPGFKIPIVVLQKGVYKFAFPISLIKTQENQADKLDTLQQNAKDFNSFRAEVNNLLISLGLNTKLVVDSDLRLQEIREELEKYETHITAEELASVDYDKMNLINDAKIKIDPNDVFISSPKLTVDFSKATIGDEVSITSEATELRKDIIQDVIVLRNIINSSPDLPDNSRFTQAFAENDIENQGSDIMNRKDIKFIKAMFFNSDKKIAINSKDLTVKALGKENLLNLRKKLENLKLLEDQVQIRKDKETAKKLNCN